MKAAGSDDDYTDTLKKTFGKRGWYFGMILFIMMLTIPIVIFFQLLAQFLYPIILVIIELSNGKNLPLDFTSIIWNSFSYTWTCIIIFAYLFALTAIRDISIFIKINTYGVVFAIIIISFIIVNGIHALSTAEFNIVTTNSGAAAIDDSKVATIYLFSSGYAPLMGILGGGFYLHNISLPIYRKSKNPENNVRDMFFGFLLVCLSYIFCGIMGTFAFSNKN